MEETKELNKKVEDLLIKLEILNNQFIPGLIKWLLSSVLINLKCYNIK